jgi:hypothetical protein
MRCRDACSFDRSSRLRVPCNGPATPVQLNYGLTQAGRSGAARPEDEVLGRLLLVVTDADGWPGRFKPG